MLLTIIGIYSVRKNNIYILFENISFLNFFIYYVSYYI